MTALVPDFAERFPLSARTESAAPDITPDDDGSQGYLERSVRAQLKQAVGLLLNDVRAAVRSKTPSAPERLMPAVRHTM